MSKLLFAEPETLRQKFYQNSQLQELWDSFGESAVEFEILDVLDHEENTQANPVEELHILTEMWIQKLKKAGYSIVCL